LQSVKRGEKKENIMKKSPWKGITIHPSSNQGKEGESPNDPGKVEL